MKTCDLASVALPLTSRYWVYPSFLLLPVSSWGSVTANALLCRIAPPPHPPDPCSLLICWFSQLWQRTQWLGLVVGVSDLQPQPLAGHALLMVRFRWVYGLSFRPTKCWLGYRSPARNCCLPFARSLWPFHLRNSSVVLSYDLVLLAPVSLPCCGRMGYVVRLRVGCLRCLV